MTDQVTSDAKKTAFKTELLLKLGLTAGLATAFGSRVHMIKAAKRPDKADRIMCSDGSWIEISKADRTMRTWGSGRTARELAEQIAVVNSDPVWKVDHKQISAIAAAPGAPRRANPVLSDDTLEKLADSWRSRMYTDVEAQDDGVWIGLGDTRLFDNGQRVTIYGPITDEAILALVGKAQTQWSNGLQLFGNWTDGDRGRVWFCCQRHGVRLGDYEPSAKLLAEWEAYRAASEDGTGRPIRPDGVASGPAPAIEGGPADAAPAPEDPVDVTKAIDLGDFDRQVESLDRRQADLERRQTLTLKSRVDALQHEQRLDLRAAQAKAFEERDALRAEQDLIAEARDILERARNLAIEKGLNFQSAVALAKADHLAEKQSYQPRSGLRS